MSSQATTVVDDGRGSQLTETAPANLVGQSKSREERLARTKRIFHKMDKAGKNQVKYDELTSFLEDRYQMFDINDLADNLFRELGKKKETESINYEDLANYIERRESTLQQAFSGLDRKNDQKLDLDEIKVGLAALNLDVDEEKLHYFFNVIDTDEDGYISYNDWRYSLLFLPNISALPALTVAYQFFIEDQDLTSDGDLTFGSETLQGIGYFLAGGCAGVVSRTCTAPFDRLKVYLIAQSGLTSQLKSGGEVVGSAVKGAGNKVVQAPKVSLISAVKYLWSQGGIRAFFVGNGLNVIKVFPESAMKFGMFETAKRLFVRLEGVSDTSEVSRAATFISGGLGGMAAQFTVYPIDTLKFRFQCESQFSKLHGRALLAETFMKMWNQGKLKMFYRGFPVGVMGIFPFAALDLGTFSAMKKAYISRQAKLLDIDESNVKINNMLVLSMGALSGSVGASIVYPINLLRTRLQTQGTSAHPYTYTGFADVYRKTVKRDGYKGLFRGLVPNLAKVAPAVSISYLVYENAKTVMGLA